MRFHRGIKNLRRMGKMRKKNRRNADSLNESIESLYESSSQLEEAKKQRKIAKLLADTLIKQRSINHFGERMRVAYGEERRK